MPTVALREQIRRGKRCSAGQKPKSAANRSSSFSTRRIANGRGPASSISSRATPSSVTCPHMIGLRCCSTHLHGGRKMTAPRPWLPGRWLRPARVTASRDCDRRRQVVIGASSREEGAPATIMRRMAWRHGRAQRTEMPTPPAGKPGSVLDPMNQLAYLNSGRAFRASLVPPGRTIFLSIIFRLIKGTTTYFVPRPRKPPTDRTA